MTSTQYLADMIRLGAMLHPQGRRSFFRGLSPRTCALGAAAEASGFQFDSVGGWRVGGWRDGVGWHDGAVVVYLYLKFPALAISHVLCPHCGVYGGLRATIICLNDTAEWTREQIADWIERNVTDASTSAANHHDTPQALPECAMDGAVAIRPTYAAV